MKLNQEPLTTSLMLAKPCDLLAQQQAESSLSSFISSMKIHVIHMIKNALFSIQLSRRVCGIVH